MNRLLAVLVLVLMLFMPQAGWAGSSYPDPYRQTTWNNFTDTVHTIGQSPQQAKLTKMRLRYARTTARVKSIQQSRMHR